MNSEVHLSLRPTPDQQRKLVELQQAFAQVCNALAPVVQETRTWNRVALHHLTYHKLRQQFPELGSQMVCNAIYAVSRASRLVFQSPGSPFHHSRLQGATLPLLRFADQCPVYFDRHTLSIKQGIASMFTMDGRIRFELQLTPEVERAFLERKLSEILLSQQGEVFVLTIRFHPTASPAPQAVAAPPGSAAMPVEKHPVNTTASAPESLDWPQYLSVQALA